MMKIDNATPKRLAATARLDTDSPIEEDQDVQPPGAEDADLHVLFEAWSLWSRTRRFYAPAPPAGTILGKLSSKTRPFTRGAPDAQCNMDLAALHLAILGQPREALDTQVFWAFYGERKSNIKRTADEIGISRVHFYRLLKAFCIRVRSIGRDIAGYNLAARAELAHWTEDKSA